MNIYTIVYERPYNPFKSYPQNANRNIAFKSVRGLEEVTNAVKEISAKGYPVKHIINNIGNIIKLD